jgi:hypothetical protein
MKITDLEGVEIAVSDLHLAILQADDYRHYRVTEPTEYQLYLFQYWEDVYQKLLLLDKEIQSKK